MRISQVVGNVVKLALLGAIAYGVIKWQGMGTQDSEATAFAERACVDAAGTRYDVTGVRPTSIKKSNDGFVVRLTVTTATGNPAMVICLANEYGGVRDVSIEER